MRRLQGVAGPELHRAIDPARISHVYIWTTNSQLDYLRFPRGGLPKPKVRELAEKMGFVMPQNPTAKTYASSPMAITPK